METLVRGADPHDRTERVAHEHLDPECDHDEERLDGRVNRRYVRYERRHEHAPRNDENQADDAGAGDGRERADVARREAEIGDESQRRPRADVPDDERERMEGERARDARERIAEER